MQKAFYRATYQRYELVAPNIYLGDCSGEMDLLAIRRSGYIDEIEIKVSKPDFKADFNKTVWCPEEHKYILKHRSIKENTRLCNYFSFLLPEALSGNCEIPEYAGLFIYHANGIVREEKRAPLLHRRKIDTELKYSIGRKMTYRYWHG